MGNMFDQFDAPSIAGRVAPNALPAAQSAPVGPMPSGAYAPDWLKAQTDSSAKDSDNTLQQSQGAVESLYHIQNLKNLVQQAPDEVFGPFNGTATMKTINSAIGSLTGNAGGYSQGMGYGTPTGRGPSDLAAWKDKLDAAYNTAAIPMIKQLYGGLPRTPEQQDKALGTLGGTTLEDKSTALQVLDNAAVESYGQIARGINAGRVDPRAVLQAPKSADAAAALGRGALYIAPDGSVRKNPL